MPLLLRSVYELAVLADHGEIDKPRSIVIGRRKTHAEPARIVVAQRLQRGDQFGAAEVAAGPAQPFDEYLGREEALGIWCLAF